MWPSSIKKIYSSTENSFLANISLFFHGNMISTCSKISQISKKISLQISTTGSNFQQVAKYMKGFLEIVFSYMSYSQNLANSSSWWSPPHHTFEKKKTVLHNHFNFMHITTIFTLLMHFLISEEKFILALANTLVISVLGFGWFWF
jgi:hypothetical protein